MSKYFKEKLLDDIYKKCKELIDEENQHNEEYQIKERYTLQNYEYVEEIISDYFFDNGLFKKIEKELKEKYK